MTPAAGKAPMKQRRPMKDTHRTTAVANNRYQSGPKSVAQRRKQVIPKLSWLVEDPGRPCVGETPPAHRAQSFRCMVAAATKHGPRQLPWIWCGSRKTTPPWRRTAPASVVVVRGYWKPEKAFAGDSRNTRPDRAFSKLLQAGRGLARGGAAMPGSRCRIRSIADLQEVTRGRPEATAPALTKRRRPTAGRAQRHGRGDEAVVASGPAGDGHAHRWHTGHTKGASSSSLPPTSTASTPPSSVVRPPGDSRREKGATPRSGEWEAGSGPRRPTAA
ncbi:hypothetical protein C2845_PM02G11710 [Panicum miliaceum]|uniref:Uncharacterized protein n=1 Tax=Panicum miliaceum TaxID=4540 RepID=A0A3L6SDL9_PANMI|nr:hypothetical protein C2845_PM02G11710 [Panicum miliaceum]